MRLCIVALAVLLCAGTAGSASEKIYSTVEVARATQKAFVCGRATGMIELAEAVGRSDIAQKTKAVRIEAGCEAIDELQKIDLLSKPSNGE